MPAAAGVIADVFRLLAEAPAVPTHTIADTAEDEKTSSIPLFYFPETEETDIEEIDPAYGAAGVLLLICKGWKQPFFIPAKLAKGYVSCFGKM